MPNAAAGTIDEVLKRLNALDEKLAPDDGVRWFNRLYRDVTKRLVEELKTSRAKRPTFLERLDVFFGNAYFEALETADKSGSDLPEKYPFHAWKPLFEARRRRDIAPIQFALAGMNAHVNFDLAVGIGHTCTTLDIAPDRGTPEYKEYLKVNDVMREAEEAAELWLLTGALQELNRRFSPIDDVVAIWSLKHARDAAWTRAEVLWTVREQGPIERAFVDVLDRATGMAGRAFLIPCPFVEGGPTIVVSSPAAPP